MKKDELIDLVNRYKKTSTLDVMDIAFEIAIETIPDEHINEIFDNFMFAFHCMEENERDFKRSQEKAKDE